jgi:hypothetical protein
MFVFAVVVGLWPLIPVLSSGDEATGDGRDQAAAYSAWTCFASSTISPTKILLKPETLVMIAGGTDWERVWFTVCSLVSRGTEEEIEVEKSTETCTDLTESLLLEFHPPHGLVSVALVFV